jgi:hypothetical protein
MGCVVDATLRPLYHRETPGTHCIRGWVDPKARLEGCGKPRPFRDSIPDRPVRRKSLYRLSYPDPREKKSTVTIRGIYYVWEYEI